MGVADNKSYKDQYHFKDNFFNNLEDLPSVNVDPAINTTIKENPYRSNVEVEKDEIILKPDMSALFKARGKTHKQGGIDVQLEPDSFVFSDYKKLAFSKKDHELMELKEGGTFAASKNTPADVLKRNIDVKHYNRLIANIQDIEKDDLAKSSSTKMLEKYIKTLGNIAYLQESKKNFPDGLPPFAEGTAPVYDPSLKNEIIQQKQYAKLGGNIKAQAGKIVDMSTPFQFGDKWYITKNGQMIEVPKPQNPNYNPPSQSWDGNHLRQAPQIPAANTADYFLHPSQQKYNPPVQRTQNENYFLYPNNTYPPANILRGSSTSSVRGDHSVQSQEGFTGRYTGPGFNTPGSNDPTGQAKVASGPHYSGVPFGDKQIPSTIPPTRQPLGNIIPRTVVNTPIEPMVNPKVPEITPGGNGVKRADWQFTPWQKESQAYNLWKWASATRYMPYRSHLNPSFVDPQLVNPEQAIGDAKASFNSQLSGINSLSPILRNAQASESYGQLLNQMPGIRSQYDNQNVGITNSFRQQNNQIANNARATNMGNDQNYYKETVVGQQNFDNLRSFLGDKYMSDRMDDVSTNQSLSYNLLTQKNPAYDYDWRTGNFTRTNKDIRDVQDSAGNDMYDKILKGVDKLSDSDPKKWEIYERIMRQKNILPYLKQSKKRWIN